MSMTHAHQMLQALQACAGARRSSLGSGFLISAVDLQTMGAPKARFQPCGQGPGGQDWVFSIEGSSEFLRAVKTKGTDGKLAWWIRPQNLSRRDLHKAFLHRLGIAQSERSSRGDWGEYERQVMLDLVNTERRIRGLDPVQMDEITLVDVMASGHSDYSTKFSLYCAEIAMGKDARQILP